MSAFIDYYAILKINVDATNKEIIAAFKKQSMRWHPDRNSGIDTTKMMQEINEAKHILLNSLLRRNYNIDYYNYRDNSGWQQSNNGQQHNYEDELKKEKQRQEDRKREYRKRYGNAKEKVVSQRLKEPFFYEIYESQILSKTDHELLSVCVKAFNYQDDFISLVIIELHENRKYALDIIYDKIEAAKSFTNSIKVKESKWKRRVIQYLIWCILASLSRGCHN